MALTGTAEGAPVMCPAPLASCADGALLALTALAGRTVADVSDGAALLGERAAIFGYTRQGSSAPGGSCRLLRAADGWIAANLARDDDWPLLAAWLDGTAASNWDEVGAAVARQGTDVLIERARLLGLAIAPFGAAPTISPGWYRTVSTAPQRSPPSHQPVVVDLSTLWAGPLCGHLLHGLGARVIKVESASRPDGARRGSAAFFDLMNGGKESVALDLTASRGREQLRRLLAQADIVIESARPRGLQQLGIAAEAIVGDNPGLTWISITGYGRSEPEANWVAFGDDAGVAAGLSRLLPWVAGKPIFCGDAIADPLTGLHAALLAYASFRSGHGGLFALALRDVAAHAAAFGAPADANFDARRRDWERHLDREGLTAAAPRARTPRQSAQPLGADTIAVLDHFGIPC